MDFGMEDIGCRFQGQVTALLIEMKSALPVRRAGSHFPRLQVIWTGGWMRVGRVALATLLGPLNPSRRGRPSHQGLVTRANDILPHSPPTPAVITYPSTTPPHTCYSPSRRFQHQLSVNLVLILGKHQPWTEVILKKNNKKGNLFSKYPYLIRNIKQCINRP